MWESQLSTLLACPPFPLLSNLQFHLHTSYFWNYLKNLMMCHRSWYLKARAPMVGLHTTVPVKSSHQNTCQCVGMNYWGLTDMYLTLAVGLFHLVGKVTHLGPLFSGCTPYWNKIANINEINTTPPSLSYCLEKLSFCVSWDATKNHVHLKSDLSKTTDTLGIQSVKTNVFNSWK